MSWACATVAPWIVAAGWLVSFTASAGQDADGGISAAALAGKSVAQAAILIPAAPALAAFSVRLPWLDLEDLVTARLSVDDPLPFDAAMAGVPPRPDLKASVRGYPLVLRERKGDPLVALRPTLSRRGLDARGRQDPAMREPGQVVFARDANLLPPRPIVAGLLDAPAAETALAFEPWPSDSGTTSTATAPASPTVGAVSAMTYDPSRPPDALDGGTPSVPRAVALGSTTPAPADDMPVEIAAAPVSLPPEGKSATSVTTKSESPRAHYADLIDPGRMSQEQRCLAEAVYFEARSEPEAGQAAVAQVVLNRVKSGLYPRSVCGVVYQNRNRYLACQFSFACEGKSLRITEPAPWRAAVRIAREVTEGKTYLADVGGATHYHANYVRPGWSRKLKKMDVIGRHVFYKLRPGQT